MAKLSEDALKLGAKAVRLARAGLTPTRPRFELVPGLGLGPVLLHTTLAEVQEALAEVPGAIVGHRVRTWADQLGGLLPDPPDGALATFFDGALHVDLDGEGRVRHVSAAFSERFAVELDGLEVFDTPAEAVLAQAATHEPEPAAVRYAPDDVSLPVSGLTFQGADPRHDLLGEGTRAVWARVGVGRTEGAA